MHVAVVDKIRANPLWSIYLRSDGFYRFNFKLQSQKKAVTMGVRSSVIDIIKLRDDFIFEWFGRTTYDEVQSTYGSSDYFFRGRLNVGYMSIIGRVVFNSKLIPVTHDEHGYVKLRRCGESGVGASVTISEIFKMSEGLGVSYFGSFSGLKVYVHAVDGDFIIDNQPSLSVTYSARKEDEYIKPVKGYFYRKDRSSYLCENVVSGLRYRTNFSTKEDAIGEYIKITREWYGYTPIIEE